MSLTSQLLYSAEIAQYDYQPNSLSLSPPSQKAQYHFHSFDKLPCNSLNSCKVQNSVLQWTYSLKNRICISISGNAWFAKFLAWLNGWTARLIGLGISNSSWRRAWWQDDRSEKASSHLLPSRLQQWCRSERRYLVRQFSERRWDGQVPSRGPVLPLWKAAAHNLLQNCTLH